MIDLDVHVEPRLFGSVEGWAAGGNPDERRAAVGELVSREPEFGTEGQGIASAPEHWFTLQQMGQASFWAQQRALLGYLQACLPESVMAIRPFVPPVPDYRHAAVIVDPVPGLQTCYGNGRGHQIFGLYEGAAPEEILLFLSLTSYTHLTNLITTPPSPQPPPDPPT